MKYVMSDIHGRYQSYMDMLKLIKFSDEDDLYIIGDIIDRGDHGIKILKDVMSRPNIHMIMGNHEYMMLLSLLSKGKEEEATYMKHWISNGGGTTLKELQNESGADIRKYLDFIIDLPGFINVEVNQKHFHLVHGFPGDNLYDQVWGRPKVDTPNPLDNDCTVIIGHTIVLYFHGDTPEERENYYNELVLTNEHLKIEHAPGFICIDCGCASNDRLISRLACLRLDDMQEFYV